MKSLRGTAMPGKMYKGKEGNELRKDDLLLCCDVFEWYISTRRTAFWFIVLRRSPSSGLPFPTSRTSMYETDLDLYYEEVT